MQLPMIIGIDGGGTKTAACLAKLSPSGPVVLGRSSSGPSNLVAVGQEIALRNLEAALSDLFESSGIETRSVASACFALAGSDRPEVQQIVRQWASSRQIADRIHIVNDAEPLLSEFDTAIAKVALICGTGSFAYGRSIDDRIARAGGWGPVIGDEGSGYWIGIELLRAVSLFFDERLQRSKLIDRAVTELQLTDPRELPRFIANRGRPYVASLSAWVEEAAATGDELAVTICENAANSLYELVRAVVSKLNLASREFDVILAGGVLLKGSVVSELFLRTCQASAIQPRDVHRSSDAAMGAVRLASKKLLKEVNDLPT